MALRIFLIMTIGTLAANAQNSGTITQSNSIQITENAGFAPFKISIGEKLKDYMLTGLQGLDEANATILTPDSTTVNGNALLVKDYSFPVEGTYIIRFTRVQNYNHAHDPSDGHVCDHYSLPAQIIVIANPNRIEYLPETFTLSQKIVGGQPTEHITASIQVIVTGENVTMPNQFYNSGIKTNRTGQLNPAQATLSAGTHTLQYQLQVMGNPGTFIQFKFIDANGHEMPCGVTTPL